MRVLPFVLLALLTVDAQADGSVRTQAEQLRDRALDDGTAWHVLDSLVTEIGARPVGSPAMTKAKDWAIEKLTALGLQNVHAEEFPKENAWFRGDESAQVTTPYSHRLSILGLGNSVPTPSGGVEGEVVVFSSIEDLTAAPPGSLAGKIVVLNRSITAAQGEFGYRDAAPGRREGPSIAAARGAIAFLVRSLSTNNARLPHTGALRYAEGVPRVPAAALAVTDADLIERLARQGKPVKVRVSLASRVVPRTPAWNVVGEITGREAQDEVIVIGGHLDSWDVSESATDDAAGVAICVAAAHLIGSLPVRPRRTIRVVLWGSEETGGSGAAYADRHRSELTKFIVASESDLGAGRIYQVAFSGDSWKDPRLTDLVAVLAPLGIFASRQPAIFAGSDVEDLRSSGVPIMRFSQDDRYYFDTHHSADDTLNKIDPADLNQNVAAWAALIFWIAESGVVLDARNP
jgi:Zn-dependent M28 family amino/carboxypeptidase